MSGSICNKKGLSMIEVLIALFLTMIGVMALISMQPQGWLLAGKSDYLGRASELLIKELQRNETLIMNPCNAVAAGTTNQIRFASGQAAAQPGDAQFNVQTTIAPSAITANAWNVTVTVTWTGNPVGITESLVVTRQDAYCQGCSMGTPYCP
ncbi:MAG: prepilin-type N-terminal cleavage/methylation domain-containing protein [Nitrospirota bacterium]